MAALPAGSVDRWDKHARAAVVRLLTATEFAAEAARAGEHGSALLVPQKLPAGLVPLLLPGHSCRVSGGPWLKQAAGAEQARSLTRMGTPPALKHASCMARVNRTHTFRRGSGPMSRLLRALALSTTFSLNPPPPHPPPHTPHSNARPASVPRPPCTRGS